MTPFVTLVMSIDCIGSFWLVSFQVWDDWIGFTKVGLLKTVERKFKSQALR